MVVLLCYDVSLMSQRSFKMRRYNLLYQGAESHDGFRLVGPFPSGEELEAWGEHWQVENGGDARWTSIELPEFAGSVYPLPVKAPEKADLSLLDGNIAELKWKLKKYKELRKIVRERERGRAEREESPIAKSV
jgi:hypothetical protein